MADADVFARIDRLERLAHWEDLETRIAWLERLATVAGIAIAIGVGAAVGTYVWVPFIFTRGVGRRFWQALPL
jgi:antibiotic biosynthesis monooxygenase (ABM) superfamily enzyme